MLDNFDPLLSCQGLSVASEQGNMSSSGSSSSGGAIAISGDPQGSTYGSSSSTHNSGQGSSNPHARAGTQVGSCGQSSHCTSQRSGQDSSSPAERLQLQVWEAGEGLLSRGSGEACDTQGGGGGTRAGREGKGTEPEGRWMCLESEAVRGMGEVVKGDGEALGLEASGAGDLGLCAGGKDSGGSGAEGKEGEEGGQGGCEAKQNAALAGAATWGCAGKEKSSGMVPGARSSRSSSSSSYSCVGGGRGSNRSDKGLPPPLPPPQQQQQTDSWPPQQQADDLLQKQQQQQAEGWPQQGTLSQLPFLLSWSGSGAPQAQGGQHCCPDSDNAPGPEPTPFSTGSIPGSACSAAVCGPRRGHSPSSPNMAAGAALGPPHTGAPAARPSHGSASLVNAEAGGTSACALPEPYNSDATAAEPNPVWASPAKSPCPSHSSPAPVGPEQRPDVALPTSQAHAARRLVAALQANFDQ